MNYVYNIYLNFNKNYFDFYEWSDEDNIVQINKIPIIKIDTNKYLEVISNNIIINDNLFNEIYNKTEITNNKNSTCLIISDTRNIVALKFNNNKESIMISSFELNDEYQILNKIKKLKTYNMEYKILSKRNYIFKTRDEYTKNKYLLKNINKLSYDTLKYIYYECFNKENTNYNIMLNELKDKILNNDLICNKIYNILNPISTN